MENKNVGKHKKYSSLKWNRTQLMSQQEWGKEVRLLRHMALWRQLRTAQCPVETADEKSEDETSALSEVLSTAQLWRKEVQPRQNVSRIPEEIRGSFCLDSNATNNKHKVLIYTFIIQTKTTAFVMFSFICNHQ
jgi:hypothetical protein